LRPVILHLLAMKHVLTNCNINYCIIGQIHVATNEIYTNIYIYIYMNKHTHDSYCRCREQQHYPTTLLHTRIRAGELCFLLLLYYHPQGGRNPGSTPVLFFNPAPLPKEFFYLNTPILKREGSVMCTR